MSGGGGTIVRVLARKKDIVTGYKLRHITLKSCNYNRIWQLYTHKFVVDCTQNMLDGCLHDLLLEAGIIPPPPLVRIKVRES